MSDIVFSTTVLGRVWMTTFSGCNGMELSHLGSIQELFNYITTAITQVGYPYDEINKWYHSVVPGVGVLTDICCLCN